MALKASDLFNEGLVYQANLALAWRPYVAGQDPNAEALNLANEQTLRLLAAVEEFYPEAGDEHAQNHELARLESKLNLLLELVGELLTAQRPLPPARAVRLNAHAVEWREAGDGRPKPGTPVLLEVYLSSEMSRPLRLMAQTVAADPAAPEAVLATVEHLSEPVVDLLEKCIFRRHRRAIAHSRPKPRPA